MATKLVQEQLAALRLEQSRRQQELLQSLRSSSACIKYLKKDALRTYKCKQEELDAYARNLGIDADKDDDLMWIAAEGFRAEPPKPWRCCLQDGRKTAFYYNKATGQVRWDRPGDDAYKAKVAEAVEKRVIIPITLGAKTTREGSLQITATNLAGNVVCKALSEYPNIEKFGELEDRLRKTVKTPEGTFPRFYLGDASALGKRHRTCSVAAMFAVSSRQHRLRGSRLSRKREATRPVAERAPSAQSPESTIGIDPLGAN